MNVRLTALLACALALSQSACSPPTYARACHTPLPHWRTESDRLDHEGWFHELRIDAQGRLLEDGETHISDAHLADRIRQWESLQPIPQVIVNPDPAAPCDRVQAVRAMLDASRLCRAMQHLNCFEGRRDHIVR